MFLFELIINASFPVKLVMLVLAFLAILSWAFILALSGFLTKLKLEIRNFYKQFEEAKDLGKLYSELTALKKQNKKLNSIQTLFETGFKELLQLNRYPNMLASDLVNGADKAMNAILLKEENNLIGNVNFLATVGSISPYIGLFGTVWGIMIAFHGLGQLEQVSLAVVAPGISEALLATAMGLVAAIPAVMAYNGFVKDIQKIVVEYECFIEDLLGIIQRYVYNKQHEEG